MSETSSETSNAVVVSNPESKPRGSSWPVAIVLITLLLVVGGPLGYVLISWSHRVATAPGRIADAISAAAVEVLQPKIDIHQVVMNSVADLKKESKLVVYTAKVNADITQQEGYNR